MNRRAKMCMAVLAAMGFGLASAASCLGENVRPELRRMSRTLRDVLEKGCLPAGASNEAAALLADPDAGITAHWKMWLSNAVAYARANDIYSGAETMPALIHLREAPLDAPLMAWDLVLSWTKAPDPLSAAFAAASSMAAELPGATAGNRRLAIGRRLRGTASQRLVCAFTNAAAMVDSGALRNVPGEWRRACGFTAAWLASAGERFLGRSKGAPEYYFHWFFAPADPFDTNAPPGEARTLKAGLKIPACFTNEMDVYWYLHTLAGFPAPSGGKPDRWVEDDLGKIDFSEMRRATETLRGILTPAFLKELERELESAEETASGIDGVEGSLIGVYQTAYGKVVIGGKGRNVYRDPDAAVIVDAGGDDDYLFSRGAEEVGRWPVRLLIDLSGDDVYRVDGIGGPGAGILGVGVLVDRRGSDRYCQGLSTNINLRELTRCSILMADPEGQNTRIVPPLALFGDPERPAERGVMLNSGFSFGCGFMGIGVLVDECGADLYLGQKLAFGTGMCCGIGVLEDGGGDDVYAAGCASIGAGLTGSIGLVDNWAGNDHYQCLGLFESGYSAGQEWDNGYDGSGIGYGTAWRSEKRGNEPRPTLGGGIGIVRDRRGDDSYIGSSFGIASGYAGGAGAVFDESGSDTYFVKRGPDGANHSSWSGNHALGNGCHRGMGFLVDVEGNDRYSAAMLGGGTAWDLGVGFLVDLGGNDCMCDLHGKGEMGNTGWAAAKSLAVSWHRGGADRYERSRFGDATVLGEGYPGVGGNFAFFFDIGREKDSYPKGSVPAYANDSFVLPQAMKTREADGRECFMGIGLFVDGIPALRPSPRPPASLQSAADSERRAGSD